MLNCFISVRRFQPFQQNITDCCLQIILHFVNYIYIILYVNFPKLIILQLQQPCFFSKVQPHRPRDGICSKCFTNWRNLDLSDLLDWSVGFRIIGTTCSKIAKGWWNRSDCPHQKEMKLNIVANQWHADEQKPFKTQGIFPPRLPQIIFIEIIPFSPVNDLLILGNKDSRIEIRTGHQHVRNHKAVNLWPKRLMKMICKWTFETPPLGKLSWLWENPWKTSS